MEDSSIGFILVVIFVFVAVGLAMLASWITEEFDDVDLYE